MMRTGSSGSFLASLPTKAYSVGSAPVSMFRVVSAATVLGSIFFAAVVLTLGAAFAQAQTSAVSQVPVISTVAGDGIAVYSGDGGAAINAAVNQPVGVAMDSLGNLYIADTGNSRIRKVTPDGAITTVAGNGTAGYNGDNIAATSAQINTPTGVAVDNTGNVYIADLLNQRIRMVTPSGIITTVAGTGTGGFNGDNIAATGAELYAPAAVAVDGSGNLYIADAGNSRIRKVPPGGIITTVAGNGTAGYNGDNVAATSAELNFADGVAVDGAGNLYIADNMNSRVRKVTLGGTITTVAGTGSYSSGSDSDNVPATSALLVSPQGVAVDGSGNLYISDFGTVYVNSNSVGSPRISKVTADGILHFVAGIGSCTYLDGNQCYNGDNIAAISSELDHPGGIVLDGSGNLYIADSGNDRVREVSGAGAPVAFAQTAIGTVSTTQNVLLGINNSLTISSIAVPPSQGGKQEFAIGAITGCVTDGITSNAAGSICTVPVILSPAYPGQRQMPLVMQTSAGVFQFALQGTGIGPLVTFEPGTVSTIAGNGINGYNSDNIAATTAELSEPYAVAVNAAGNVYIADSDNSRVRLVTPGGIITTVAGTGAFGYNGDNIAATGAELSYPTGVAVDGAGNLYIADTGNNRVREVTPGGTITTVAGIGGTSCSFTGDGGQATSAALCYPYGVAVDGSGNLYIVDSGNERVRKVTPEGTITTVVGNGTQGYNGDNIAATSAELYSPTAIALDGSGNFYIVDSGNDRIRKVTMPGGTITTVAGNGVFGYNGDNIAATSAELDNVNSVALDASGNLYIADSYNQRIRKVTPGGTIATVAGNGTSGYNNDNIPATSAEMDYPAGLALDGSGNLYIADLGNNRIREVDVSYPPALTFVGANVGTASASQDVTVLNLGNAPLDITQISTATNFSLGGADTTCGSTGQTLSAAASCVLGIEFNPTADGSISGSVVLTDNALNASTATQTIVLQGTGTGPQSQTITFPNPGTQTYGVVPITLTATATSGLPVTYTVTPGPATVSGSTLTITGAGSVTVQANQPGDGIKWAAATSVSQSFTVNPAALTVTANNANMVYGQAVPSFSYSFTGFVNSDTSAVLSGTATETTAATSTSPAGTYPITFSTEPITATNYTFSYVIGTLTISGGATQTITFGASPNVTYGVSPITLGATASSNLPVSYAVTGPATVSSSTLTITGAGLVTVTASQAGNANYGAATSVSQSFTVNPTTPTVSFTGAPASAGYTSTFTVSATTNASSSAVFSATGACTVAGSGVVTITSGTGTCSLGANWAADSNYLAASATQSTTATTASQTITVGTPAPGSATYGSNFTVAATANSGLAVAYTSSGGCTNSGTTFTMSSGTTTCAVQFNQAGNTNYAAATQVIETVSAKLSGEAALTVTGMPTTAQAYGAIFTVGSSGGSGTGTVTFAASGACSNNGTTVTMTSGTGACSVMATKAADSNYNGAISAPATVSAAQASQAITVGTPAPGSAVYNSNFTVGATASSGLAVTYTSSGGCTNSGATFTMTNPATACSVIFNQAGNPNYVAATQVIESVTAAKAAQTIAVTTAAPSSAAYSSTFPVAATASSGLTVAVTVSGGCTISGGTITMNSPTTACTVKFNQAGNADFNAATQLTETATATKASQSITVTTAAPASAAYNGKFSVAATASSGLTVVITVSGGCIISSGTVTMKSPTTACAVNFNQAGNTDYNAAPQLTETVAATPTNQTITVTTAAPASAAYNSKFTVAATSSSGLAVAYTSSGGCTNSGATFTMTSGATSCTVQFNQAGNADYAAATQVIETVTATKATQTITFPNPRTQTYSVAPLTLSATASSALAVSYSVTSGPATVSGSTLSITGAGSVTVQASQAGNSNFGSATAVSVSFTVNKTTSSTSIKSETPNPSTTGESVVVGFTVSGAGIAPTGTVTVTGTGSVTCTGTLSAGAGSCSLRFTTTGSKTLTGAYSGDNNYGTSTSAKVTQTVSQ